MINHVRLEIPHRVEGFSAFLAGNFLLGAVIVVDVISQSWIAVETLWKGIEGLNQGIEACNSILLHTLPHSG
jgi:hypothetical protein